MKVDFFNYEVTVATGRREMASVLDAYWRLHAGDRSWTSPFWSHLLAALQHPYIQQRMLGMVRLDAMMRRRAPRQAQRGMSALPLPTVDPTVGSMPVPVGTALLLRDTRAPRTAHLALLGTRNNKEVMERIMEQAAELLRPAGLRQLVGPLGLTPYLGGGAQISHWHEPAPLHTTYTPPYLAELLGRVFGQPEGAPEAAGWPVHSRLWQAAVPAMPPSPEGLATLRPLAPARLADDLLPLLTAATPPGWARPRDEDARFLVDWLSRWPLWGWLAEVGGEPAGFILLQPDVGPGLRRLRGGRRLWLRWAEIVRRFPTGTGRLYLGAVLPEFRRRGIGHQLWQQALGDAGARGWRNLIVGPVAERATAAEAALTGWGAVPHQRFRLFSTQAI